MIVYLQGNIMNTPAVTIVNTVNTVGVMGKGIALSCKNRYPEMFEIYQNACREKTLHVGQLMYYKAVDHDVLLFPTKAHWKYPSRIKWIEDGLKAFRQEYESYGVTSIAFPMLGCGNGGLNWNDVKPLMESYLSDLPIQIYIYTGLGPALEVSDKPIKDYNVWLQSIALSFDVDAVLQRFSEHLMLPYEFYYHGAKCEMLYLPGEISITSNAQSLVIKEKEFIRLWESWKLTGFIEIDMPEMLPFYVMLMTMGYLEPVYIENGEGLPLGYQLLLMCDRAEKMKGDSV